MTAVKSDATSGDEGDPWTLSYDCYDPAQEPLREALCTLGNGVFASRGAAPECGAGGVHYPGTYVAGLYDRAITRQGDRVVENEDLVNAPNWLPLTFQVDGGMWFSLDTVEVLAFRQELDMRRGLLHRTAVVRDDLGRRTSVTSRCLVHMAFPHLAILEVWVRPEDWSGRVTVRSTLDGGVRNDGVARYRGLEGKHLEVLQRRRIDADSVLLLTRTLQSRVEVALAARTRVDIDGRVALVEQRHVEDRDLVGSGLMLDVRAGTTLHVEKVVSLYTGRHVAVSEAAAAATAEIQASGKATALVERHVAAWEAIWRRFDTDLSGPDRMRKALRLHLFHLLQTVSRHTTDLDVGVPARGLHGEAYRGHVFWDDLFVLPLLTYQFPELTRSLLRYRHRRLPAARRAAHEAGGTGAAIPWQSGSDGREESQRVHLNPRSGRWVPDRSWRQRHVGLAVAYEVWHYVEVTGDLEFLSQYGLELVVEVARYFTDLAVHDQATNRYRIEGVMGPDEFHDDDPGWNGPGLRNNAYTNVLLTWLLSVAPRLLESLPPTDRAEVVARLQLRDEELRHWDTVSRRLTVPFHADGVISQFEGYEDLEELDWAAYRGRYGDIARLDRILEAEGSSVNRFKASKQADVLMLCYLFSYEQLQELLARLGYRLNAEQLRHTVAYYLQRTSHGSTLSALVHSWVLARTDRRTSLALFEEALRSDVDAAQGGTTAEGIHLGAMAGSMDLLLRGYSGMEVRDSTLLFKPSLPRGIDRLRFRICYRQRWITVTLAGDDIELECEALPGTPVLVEVRGNRRVLKSGCVLRFSGAAHVARRHDTAAGRSQ